MLLDVDGPLNPFAAKNTRRPEGFHTHRMRPEGFEIGKPLRVWLNPDMGPKLLKLGYEIVWATAWRHDANIWIGPHVGLPKLPFINFGIHEDHRDSKLHWKTQQIASYMEKNYPGRDFIWIDDEVKDHDAEYLRKYLPVGIEIFKIDDKTGITDKDMENIRNWKDKKDSGKYTE